MGKRFRTDHLDQALLLPPSLHDWLPEGHLARFIADVVEELDLKAVYISYEGDGRGLVGSLLRPGPLRSLHLAPLDIDILPHPAGLGLGRPGGSGAWRRPKGGAV